MKQETLWTKNFTIITIGTIISAIGGVAIQFALSLLVYDQTNSTLLAGSFAAISLLPSLFSPYFFLLSLIFFLVNLYLFFRFM